MTEPTDAFWDDLERLVASTTETALGVGDCRRAPTIAYLREVEAVVRQSRARCRTVEAVTSARRILGDTFVIDPADGSLAPCINVAR